MDAPKPKPCPPIVKSPSPIAPVQKIPAESVPLPVGENVETKTEEKKPFVLRPHLTERPLKHHEGLEALKQSLQPNDPPRNPGRRKPSRRLFDMKGEK